MKMASWREVVGLGSPVGVERKVTELRSTVALDLQGEEVPAQCLCRQHGSSTE